jgi:phosphopantothenoylcysteine decarboxylase/phosphopantothenate--cysteine ligase
MPALAMIGTARVVLGISGGIAAYKAADLASKLVQLGATVDAILTVGAQEFVQPLTFEAITKRPVHVGVFEPWTERSSGHVSLANEADILVVAPASGNTLAKLAVGMAGDMLGAVALSTHAPLLIAPAMEHGMFHHAATQAHLQTLRDRGATHVGPEYGRLASGMMGDGRMAGVATIVGAIRWVLGRGGALAGRHIVITAGGTREPLDPVRYLGNRSSGQMGYALAQAAIDRGATVTLITTVTALTPPYGAATTRVETADEMDAAVKVAVREADVLIMAAAVADFRPTNAATSKMKKQGGQAGLALQLERTPDILANACGENLVKIGFAAETEDLVENALKKLESKGLTMIVANDATATIGQAESTATILWRGKPPEQLGTMAKVDLAHEIMERLVILTAGDQ